MPCVLMRRVLTIDLIMIFHVDDSGDKKFSRCHDDDTYIKDLIRERLIFNLMYQYIIKKSKILYIFGILGLLNRLYLLLIQMMCNSF